MNQRRGRMDALISTQQRFVGLWNGVSCLMLSRSWYFFYSAHLGFVSQNNQRSLKVYGDLNMAVAAPLSRNCNKFF